LQQVLETRNCTKNKEKAICANCTGKGLGFTDYKAWSKSCIVCKKTREALVVRFCNRPLTYLKAVCLDHRLVVLLVVEKELKKQGPGRPKGFVRASTSQAPWGDAIEVDSRPSQPLAKQPKQATLSFRVTKWLARYVLGVGISNCCLFRQIL
jgi:hypothetical protein